MLLASFSYFERTPTIADRSKKGIRARIIQGACLLVCSFIVGCGEGFLQGLVIFKDFGERGFYGLAQGGDMTAGAGGAYAAIACPIVYYIFLRNYLDLTVVTRLIAITLISGLISALLIGWGSAIVTLVALVITSVFLGISLASHHAAGT
jgi:hypothetical protein